MSLSVLMSRQSRAYESVIGSMALLLGVPLLGLTLLGSWRIIERWPDVMPTTSVLVVLGSAAAIGLFLSSAGLRLATDRRRDDGGLLSPIVLVLGGLFFLSAPAILFWLEGSTTVSMSAMWLAGIACFVLARQRVRSR